MWRVNALDEKAASVRECLSTGRLFDRDKSREILIARAISRVAQRSSGQEVGSHVFKLSDRDERA